MKPMILKALCYVAVLCAWLVLIAILLPAVPLARNRAAVASVSNSDTAFYAQRVIEDSTRMPAASAGVLFITGAFWLPAIIASIKSKKKHAQ